MGRGEGGSIELVPNVLLYNLKRDGIRAAQREREREGEPREEERAVPEGG